MVPDCRVESALDSDTSGARRFICTPLSSVESPVETEGFGDAAHGRRSTGRSGRRSERLPDGLGHVRNIRFREIREVLRESFSLHKSGMQIRCAGRINVSGLYFPVNVSSTSSSARNLSLSASVERCSSHLCLPQQCSDSVSKVVPQHPRRHAQLQFPLSLGSNFT